MHRRRAACVSQGGGPMPLFTIPSLSRICAPSALILSLGVGACAVNTDAGALDEPVAAQESAIKNGDVVGPWAFMSTSRDARPVLKVDGRNCTATLLTPDWLLTAR